jgi:hypothetical protein
MWGPRGQHNQPRPLVPIPPPSRPELAARVLSQRSFDHRQDAGADRLGQFGPCIHHGGQIGVMVTTN